MPKFDVIVGNPPYQGKKIGGGVGSGNAIWQKFVELSFEILKEDGYLCFIHPVAWRYFSEIGKGKYKNVLDLLYSKQILYLKVFQTPFPGIGTVVDWYVAQNKEKYKETTIEFLNGTYDVFIESPPILNYGGDIVESIRKKVLKTEDNGFFSRKSFGGLREFDTSKPKGNYKLAHGARYLKNEWKYSEYPHIHQNHPKVIMSAVRQPRPIFDPGEIGISDHVHYILVENKEQGDFLISIFKSKLMKFLQKLYASDVLMNDDWPARWYNTTPFTKIKIDDKKLKNDKEVYQYFNLSPEEIKYIESEIR